MQGWPFATIRFANTSLFRRPPTSGRATFDARKPTVCFCRSEQASIAVAAIGILAELTQANRRHRTGLQRQARCFAQQIGLSRSAHCRRTGHDARRDLDRAEIAGAVRPLSSRDWRGFVRGLFARNLAEQPFQYFDQDGVPVINTCAICPSICFFIPAAEICALPSTRTVPQTNSHRRQHV